MQPTWDMPFVFRSNKRQRSKTDLTLSNRVSISHFFIKKSRAVRHGYKKKTYFVSNEMRFGWRIFSSFSADFPVLFSWDDALLGFSDDDFSSGAGFGCISDTGSSRLHSLKKIGWFNNVGMLLLLMHKLTSHNRFCG